VQTEVMFRFSGRLDVAEWERRHARGEVPDAWPYGLDRMAGHGVRVASAPVYAGDARLARAARGVGRYEWMESRISTGSPDVVMCWDERVGVPTVFYSRGSAGPKVVTGVIWLTDEPRSNRAHRKLGIAGLRKADLIWTSSSAQIPVLRDEFGIPARRLAHVPMGVDSDFFTPAEGSQPTPGLVIGGGNDRHRDHSTLVAALAQVRRIHPEARLELATAQPIDVPVDLGVRHTELTHVRMRELYRGCAVTAVVLHPNLHVSGITVTLEAMACGRPVVVTDNPGMRDYVEHGVTGLLVPVGDPSAVAAAVSELLADPQRALEMGAEGRRVVERRLSTAVQARGLAELVR
jgi:glycosyltransferase involved in cell wall biosynthesis